MSAPTDQSPRDTSRLPGATTAAAEAGVTEPATFVEPEHAAGRLVAGDTAYFFCALSCAGGFARQPERFVRSP